MSKIMQVKQVAISGNIIELNCRIYLTTKVEGSLLVSGFVFLADRDHPDPVCTACTGEIIGVLNRK